MHSLYQITSKFPSGTGIQCGEVRRQEFLLAGAPEIHTCVCNHNVSKQRLLAYDKSTKRSAHTLRPQLQEWNSMAISNWSSWLSGKKLNLKRSLEGTCRELVWATCWGGWGLGSRSWRREGQGGDPCRVGARPVAGLLALLGLTTANGSAGGLCSRLEPRTEASKL